MTSDVRMQELINALTDAVLRDDADIERIRQEIELPQHEVDSLLNIIEGLHDSFVPVEPSQRFVTQLRSELVQEPSWGWLWRLRSLPARFHMAAGVALFGGFMLIWRRRFMGEAAQDVEEAPILR